MPKLPRVMILPVLLIAGATHAQSPGASPSGSAATPVPLPETPRAAVPATPPPAPPPVPMTSRWGVSMYGFIELASIFDSTQSYGEVAGNAPIVHRSAAATNPSFGAEHERLTMSARSSRLGFRFKGPESDRFKTTANIEVDFLGNQPSDVTEAQLITFASVRLRHMFFRVQSPWVDVTAGQTWNLFGWQSSFHPASVQIQPIAGEVFSRSPQLRIGRTIPLGAFTLDVAVAAVRPPQRNAATPDGQAGVKLAMNRRMALHTVGSAVLVTDPAAVGVSGTVRRFAVPAVAANNSDTRTNAEAGWGVSADALVPIVPGTLDARANALTLTGSYVIGAGIADFYTNLTGGAAVLPAAATPAGYKPNVDPGLVGYDPSFDLRTIKWQSFIVGVQYYLPPTGRIWVTGNYSWLSSSNIADIAGTDRATVFKRQQFANGSVYVDVSPAVRVAGEYAYFWQKYGDDSKAHNHRGQISFFYIF